MLSENRPLVAYISAASHSGSTLLAMLLNAHDDVCTVGELKLGNLGNASVYRCSCRSLIDDCSFWNSVADRMNRHRGSFAICDSGTDLNAVQSRYARALLKPLCRSPAGELVRDGLLALSPAWRKYLPAWERRNKDLVEAVASVSGARVIVDSSKTGLRLKYLSRIPDLQVKVIRLVRDGRAVALTYMDADNFADARDPSLRGGGSGKRVTKKLDMRRSAEEWRRSNEEAENVTGIVGAENVIQVHYESLCSDPGRTLNEIAAFLGLESDPDFSRFRDFEHHVVGNGMRLDDSNEIVLDERWRNVLQSDDLDTFGRVAGDLNALYGYSA